MIEAPARELRQLERLRAWYPGPLLPGRTTPLDLLILQPTRFCNIDCDYCYLPFRQDRSRMAMETVSVVAGRIAAAGLADHELAIAWHAGEPLVLPADWYLEAMRRVRLGIGPECRITHNFQTNAMLVDDAFLAMFQRPDIRVGVSIDGPAFLHDPRRRARNGAGTHARAMRGITRLRESGIPLSAICVLSRESLDHPDALYDFFRDLEVTTVGFNIEEIEGGNPTSTLSREGAVQAYAAFFHRIFERVREAPHALRVREHDEAVQAIGTALMGRSSFGSESQAFSILSVGVEGDLVTFSPELVDLKDASGQDFTLGNLLRDDLPTLWRSARLAQLHAEVQRGLARCRAECAWFQACGGGTPANKQFENGSFASTETLHCRLTRQALLDVAETWITRRIAEGQARRRGSRPPDAHVPILRVGVPVLDAWAMRDAIRIADGTVALADHDTAMAAGYQPQARVPRPGWRVPTGDELRAMSGAPPDAPHVFVARIRLPADLATLLSRLDPGALPTDLVARLAGLFASPGLAVRSLGLHAQRVEAPTTTVDTQDMLRPGLHLDSFFRLAPDRRAEAPNRLCINVGLAPRRFMFVPVPVPAMLRELERRRLADATTHPTQIGRRYLSLFPDVPVLGLTLQPGEGYIAPTELVIHDGQPIQPGGTDRTLTLLGRFPASRAPAAPP